MAGYYAEIARELEPQSYVGIAVDLVWHLALGGDEEMWSIETAGISPGQIADQLLSSPVSPSAFADQDDAFFHVVEMPILLVITRFPKPILTQRKAAARKWDMLSGACLLPGGV